MASNLQIGKQQALTKALQAQERAPRAIEDKHYRRDMEIELSQGEVGTWYLYINGGQAMLPTDVEIQLWLENQALRSAATRAGIARARAYPHERAQ